MATSAEVLIKCREELQILVKKKNKQWNFKSMNWVN